MKKEQVMLAKAEAKRFIERVDKLLANWPDASYGWLGCKESGAVKRTSMDLTRVLAEMRQK